MTNTVALHVGDPALAAYGLVVRSSLPLSLAESPTPKGALAVVAGGVGWVERVVRAANDGAAGILVEDPGLVRDGVLLSVLHSVADRVPVLLRRPFLYNPAVRQLESGRPAPAGARTVVTELFVPPTAVQQRLLFDHLSLMRALTAPVAAIRSATLGGHGYSVSGTLRGGVAFVAGATLTTAQPAHVQLRMLRPPQRFHAEIYPDLTSRPARVTVTDADGERVEPSNYESATRLAWRTLLDAHRREARLRDVVEYVDDVTVLQGIDTALGSVSGGRAAVEAS